MRIRRKSVALFAVVAVAFVGGVGLANATGPSDKIYACASKSTGALRVVSPSTRCRSSEKSLVWNERGPQGYPGRNGTDGTDGADGVSGYEVVRAEVDLTAASDGGGAYAFDADCPAGKVVLGGGGQATFQGAGQPTASQTPAHIAGSEPFTINDADHWRVSFSKPDGSSFVTGDVLFGFVYAVCANATA